MIDTRHSGLPCRSDTPCREVFHPLKDSVAAVQTAAALRNTHEHDAHGYIHKVLPEPPSWNFSAMTNRGLAQVRRRNANR